MSTLEVSVLAAVVAICLWFMWLMGKKYKK